MKVVDGKLKVASENPRSLNPKGFQVIGCLSPSVQCVCVLFSSEFRYYMGHCSPCAHKLCQMHHLFCSSHTIKCCMTLDRLPYRYTNSIPKQSLSHGQRKCEQIAHAPELLNSWKRSVFFYILLFTSFPFSLPTQPHFLYILNILVSALR